MREVSLESSSGSPSGSSSGSPSGSPSGSTSGSSSPSHQSEQAQASSPSAHQSRQVQHSSHSINPIAGYVDPIDELPNHIRSFGRRLPKIFLERVPRIGKRCWGIEIGTLSTLIQPSLEMRQLKTQFWEIVRDSEERITRSILLEEICFGIMIEDQLLRYLEDERFVCWLLAPPVRAETVILEMLSYGMDKLREILDLPIEKTVFHKDGSRSSELNMEVMRLKLSAISMLDKRKHGEYTKRIEEKSMHIRVNQSSNNIREPKDIKELDAKIKELEKRAKLSEVSSSRESFGE